MMTLLVIVHCTVQMITSSVRLLTSYDTMKMSEGSWMELSMPSKRFPACYSSEPLSISFGTYVIRNEDAGYYFQSFQLLLDEVLLSLNPSSPFLALTVAPVTISIYSVPDDESPDI